ncbi:MAG TPA: SseB family protein [Actinocatenispora sp.]
MVDWQPGTDAELAMAAARDADNRREYFRLLSTAPLFLPLTDIPEPGEEPSGPQRFALWDMAGRTFLVVYTSAECLTATAGPGVEGYVQTNYAELSAKWPDPQWWLAVNPGMQLDCYLPIESVQKAADGTLTVPTAEEAAEKAVADPDLAPDLRALQERAARLSADREADTPPSGPAPAGDPAPQAGAASADVADDPIAPANDTEKALLAASQAGYLPAYMEALLAAEVIVPVAWPVLNVEQLGEPGFPWRPATGMEAPTIELFTSRTRFEATHDADTPTLTAPFMLVLVAWPDPSYELAVNPGSALQMRLGGQALGEFIESVEDALSDEIGEPGTVDGEIAPRAER